MNDPLFSARQSARGVRAPTRIDGVVYKIADRQSEREDAFRLIHDAYTRNGLMKPNASGMRVTPFHLLPTSDLFVAYHRGRVIYTMTLISDDERGMPMDAAFKREMDERRRSGKPYFAEVSCLASRINYFPRGKMYHVFVRLASLMVQSARENGVDRLLIACHPRQERFYRKLLGFHRISDERPYGPFLNNPAVALEHDFVKCDEHRYRLYDRIYGHIFRHWELYHQPMLREEREALAKATRFYETHFPIEGVA